MAKFTLAESELYGFALLSGHILKGDADGISLFVHLSFAFAHAEDAAAHTAAAHTAAESSRHPKDEEYEEEQRCQIEERNLKLTSDNKEVPESGVNYETVYQAFQHISPDLKSAEYEVERARYDYKIAKGRLLPSLSLGGGISTNYYKNLSQKGQYDGFASQFHNNQGEYLALTLSIPIYNSDRWHSVKKARNDWQLAQVNLEETRRKLHDQIAQAVMDAEGYAKELHQMQKKVASDSLAYHMSSRKFEEGMLSTFDLHTAAQTLLESRIKELQMQMLLIIKQRLVGYYQGENLIK